MMNDSARIGLAIVLLAGILSACAQYTLVGVERYEVADAYSLDPQREWSRARNADHEVWTIDGQALEALHLWAGIQDDEALIADRDADDKDIPVYRKGMRAGDVADLVAATVTLNGGDARITNLRPAPFGDLDGFRFDLAYANQNGLRKRAIGLGGITGNGKLHLIVYDGAAEYYFSAHKRTVEDILKSVRTI